MDKMSNQMPIIPTIGKVILCAKCFGGDIVIEVGMGGGHGEHPLLLTKMSTILDAAGVLGAAG